MIESLFGWVSQPEAWLAFGTLLLLEVVLGIDNVIFLSILAGKLPPEQQQRARTVGLLAAMLMRLALLFSITWIYRLQDDLFTAFGMGFSGRDLILILGGLFLLYKAVKEMHEQLEGPGTHEANVVNQGTANFAATIAQIMLLDIVFSLDSVITAVGMADDIGVMVCAVVVTVGIMLVAARPIGDFVQAHPTIKMLALAFLLLIGVNLIADGFGLHIPKGYTYFAMGFAILVELLNMRARRGRPVDLHETQRHPDAS
ncbi:TerC family protein [Deinococcus metallilatus]|uniref:Tellurium resistance membrane protein TerC n=1 Tax=Deinococcus metallilatus TaxID=1211322 RepID=A0AAJ5F304_9DEIO|nr:TerC family protein [Deinococcus metallilatus]MBB5296747.1 putative tellurium resistance membrane protein TerC [Deinococcus metallilatus]QBY09179.1 TerC family protein [Deinococcus metallilatus]RXJ09694.1 TerC family protein [Deinococcus metallilatus]TLK24160.1 TerC family protein [Deinococcus metallilatus]GMA13778.1 membrane protein [Deinococcus metallilatus]